MNEKAKVVSFIFSGQMDIWIAERTAARYMTIFCEKGLVGKEKYGTFINLQLEKDAGESG